MWDLRSKYPYSLEKKNIWMHNHTLNSIILRSMYILIFIEKHEYKPE